MAARQLDLTDQAMNVELYQSKRELIENWLIDFYLMEHRELYDLDALMDVALYVMSLNDQELLQTYALHFGDRDI